MSLSKVTPKKRDTYHVGNLAPQLLETARQMLAEVGPAKLSLRAVSERLGVSSTATYYHYANRSELIGHLGAQGFKELGYALKQRSEGATTYDMLRNGCLAYFNFACRNPELYQLMFGPEIKAENMIAEMKTARDEAFAELMHIISAVLAKPVDSREVRRSALASWSFTHGLVELVIHGIIPFSPETSERLVDRALQGFANLFAAGGIHAAFPPGE